MIRWESPYAARRLSVTVIEAGAELPVAESAYWLSRPVAERIAAVEFLRAQFFAPYDPARDRIQRVLRRVEPPPG